MPVMGFTKFERLFRAAAEVRVDRDDIKSYLDFVEDVIYDLLITAQATAKANIRDVIAPSDLPVTKGLQERVHEFQRIDEEIELRPLLDQLAARPPLDVSLSEEAEARLPLLYGGISVALAKMFKIVDEELTAVHRREWERAFRLFRLLI
jgi:histone H3/H4